MNKKENQVADNEKNHSKSHVQMKGVSVGLFSPDRKERYCNSMDMGDGIMSSLRKQQLLLLPPPPQAEITCSSSRQEEHRAEKRREEGEDDFFSADESRPSINFSLKRSTDEEAHNSTSPVHSFMRSAVKHSSMEDALTIEAMITKESDQELQDEELLRSTSDLFFTRLDSESRGLNMILAVAALLDFLSFLSPSLLRRDAPEEESKGSTQYLYSYLFLKVSEHIDDAGPIRKTLHFFEKHGDSIGLVFSILWFLFAFGKARRTRDWVLRMRDRKKLFNNDCTNKTSHDASSSPFKRFESEDSTVSASKLVNNMGGAHGIYLLMVSWQLLLLPVGFYTTVYQVIAGDAADYGIHKVPKCVGEECYMANVVTKKFRQSVLYVFVQQGTHFVSHRIKEEVKTEYLQRFAQLKRFLMRFAIRHPLEFRRKLRRGLQWIRWIRYLIPLVGGANKLRGNMLDLLKKRRQRREKEVLQRCFYELQDCKRLRDLNHSQQQDHAPLIIQTAWRSRQRRKQIRALKLFKQDPEMIATIKLQKHFRSWLERSRARLKRKWAELTLLQKMERESIRGRATHISAMQRRRMYLLQDELVSTAKKRRRRQMLLYPNTSSSVIWKYIFVACLIVELGQKVMKPKLTLFAEEVAAAERRKIRVEDMDWTTYLSAKILPKQVAEWDECGKALQAGKIMPWYCQRPWSDIHVAYIKTLEVAIVESLAFISFVMFCDVFVSFFTGELDEVTGQLVPKPWFKRWILPGVAVQLLLNPRMIEISAATRALICHIYHDVGPITAYRWLSSLFLPAFVFLSDRLNRHVWRRFVREENERSRTN